MADNKRRELEFKTLDEVIADVDRLLANGYEKTGNWSLGQICQHCAIFVRRSMDGFEGFPTPPFLIRLLGPWITWWVLRSKKMPTGIQVPEPLLPQDKVDEAEEVRSFREVLARFRDHAGPLCPSPFAGALSREKWTALHLVHAAHHLSFLKLKQG